MKPASRKGIRVIGARGGSRAGRSGGENLLRLSFAGGGKSVPVERTMDQSPYKDALLRKRGEILAQGGGVKPLTTSAETNSRQGDLADQASGNNEVHIQLKLKQTDAKILQAIEEALYRMEKGTFGICRDCGEPIAPARLNAIPWTRVCITCKEKQSS
jgi:DnaK suppressor protein